MQHDTFISIHTTANVVTYCTKICQKVLCNFNPHHREGGDTLFLSSSKTSIDFNPHHREGGDKGRRSIRSSHTISIHTTAKVVTL